MSAVTRAPTASSVPVPLFSGAALTLCPCLRHPQGLVGVTVDDTDAMLTMVDDMINLVDSTGTSMKSVVDSLDTSLKARGVPVTFNSKDVDSVIDSAISAVDNFQARTAGPAVPRCSWVNPQLVDSSPLPSRPYLRHCMGWKGCGFESLSRPSPQSNVDSLKTKINNAVKDVDNYMSKINTYIIIAAAVFGGFSIILLLFALWGIKARPGGTLVGIRMTL